MKLERVRDLETVLTPRTAARAGIKLARRCDCQVLFAEDGEEYYRRQLEMNTSRIFDDEIRAIILSYSSWYAMLSDEYYDGHKYHDNQAGECKNLSGCIKHDIEYHGCYPYLTAAYRYEIMKNNHKKDERSSSISGGSGEVTGMGVSDISFVKEFIKNGTDNLNRILIESKLRESLIAMLKCVLMTDHNEIEFSDTSDEILKRMHKFLKRYYVIPAVIAFDMIVSVGRPFRTAILKEIYFTKYEWEQCLLNSEDAIVQSRHFPILLPFRDLLNDIDEALPSLEMLELLMPQKYNRHDLSFWTEICVDRSKKTILDWKITDKSLTKAMYRRLEEFFGPDTLAALKEEVKATKKARKLERADSSRVSVVDFGASSSTTSTSIETPRRVSSKRASFLS